MEDKDIKLIKEIIKEYSTMDGLKEYTKALEKLLQAYKQDEQIIKYSKEFIKENTQEFYCKRDECYELTFNNETNASDLIGILEGNY